MFRWEVYFFAGGKIMFVIFIVYQWQVSDASQSVIIVRGSNYEKQNLLESY